MGIIFGMTGSKEPAYSLIKSSLNYDIRYYQPYFVAEVLSNNENDNSSFSTLAKYIGVFGTPENSKKLPLAMTAPVISKPEKISMTTPVISDSKETMQFVLPFEYQTFEDIPVPTNEKITIRSVPSRLIAVNKFSGSYNKEYFMKKLKELHQNIVQDSVFIDEGSTTTTTIEKTTTEDNVSDFDTTKLKWNIAQYHPPFTIPFLRRNEVWIELNRNNNIVLNNLIEQYELNNPQNKIL